MGNVIFTVIFLTVALLELRCNPRNTFRPPVFGSRGYKCTTALAACALSLIGTGQERHLYVVKDD